jgi:hypothetical protein
MALPLRLLPSGGVYVGARQWIAVAGATSLVEFCAAGIGSNKIMLIAQQSQPV